MSERTKRGEDNNLPTEPMLLKEFQVRALKPKAKRYDRLVGRGLTLRVNTSGTIAFRYAYRFEGRKCAFTLGTFPTVSLAKLLSRYQRANADKNDGVDPAADAKKARQQVLAEKQVQENEQAEVDRLESGMKVSELVQLFVAHIENPNSINAKGRAWSQASRRAYVSHLNKHFRPKFGRVRVEDIDAKTLSAWLGAIAVDSPVLANRVHATLRVMFGWACDLDQGYLEVNPASGIKKKGKETSKTRALDYAEETEMVTDLGEIRYFWQVTNTLNPLHRYAFQMMLLTAQRPNEVCSAKWEHIYWEEGIWVLPHTKNRRVHKIPLVPRLRAHLKALKALSGHTPFLFPQSREEGGLHVITNKDKPLTAATLNFDTRNNFPDIRAFTSHDLRRTASTHLKAVGSNIYEIGLLINNGGFSVTDIYARGSDIDTIRKVLNKWHRRLDKILDAEAESNVVNLR